MPGAQGRLGGGKESKQGYMAGHVAYIRVLFQRGVVSVRLLLQVCVVSQGWMRERRRRRQSLFVV